MAQGFPEADGRRQVLVVEDNPDFIDFLHNNLQNWNYSVVMESGAQPVLSLVLEKLEKEKFHILITTSQIQDMDCLEFVRQIRHQEPHLPIIILVCRDKDLKQMSSIMELGGCDFVCMPVKMTEELLVRMLVLTIKKININLNEMPAEAGTSTFTAVGEATASADASPKEKEKDVVDESLPAVKKPRLSWSNELHQSFIDAVNVLGLEASAAKICRNMNVEGLTREQVSSHLQKYREKKEKKKV